MASKKDLRRPDLGTLAPAARARYLSAPTTANTHQPTVIPYQEPLAKSEGADVASTLSQTLPMAAIFTRNRYIGWYFLPSSNQEREAENILYSP